MRVIGLVLLGLVAYLLSLLIMFPASFVIDRIKPQLAMVELTGVTGKLYKGAIEQARYTDDLLPLEFANVSWAIRPQAILQGGLGLGFEFEGYGGVGKGELLRTWSGDVQLNDFAMDVQATQLEPLLPVPIAAFDGRIDAQINQLVIVNNLLDRMEGTLRWSNAELTSPIPTRLGDVVVVIEPADQQIHRISLTASGGDVAMEGLVTLTVNGDFTADILFTPSASASMEVRNGLRQMGRADAQGRVRLQRQGNVNRLM